MADSDSETYNRQVINCIPMKYSKQDSSYPSIGINTEPASNDSIGYDLKATENITIPCYLQASKENPHIRAVSTNLCLDMSNQDNLQMVNVSQGQKGSLNPFKFYGQIQSRSGLALKHGIQTMGGVIDADYRGEVKVILCNLGFDSFEVKKGDKIAQLVVHMNPTVNWVECDKSELSDTSRGDKGFGSTGK